MQTKCQTTTNKSEIKGNVQSISAPVAIARTWGRILAADYEENYVQYVS